MNKPSEVRISLCDNLNHEIGYQVRVVGQDGKDLLFASRDPADGSDLLSLSDGLRVAGYYADVAKSTVDPPVAREFIPAGDYVPLSTGYGTIMVLPTDGEHFNVEVREHSFMIDGVHFCFACCVQVRPGFEAVLVGRLTEWSSGGTLTPRRKELLLREIKHRVGEAARGPMAQALKEAKRRVLNNNIRSIDEDVEEARKKLEDLISVRASLLDEESLLAT